MFSFKTAQFPTCVVKLYRRRRPVSSAWSRHATPLSYHDIQTTKLFHSSIHSSFDIRFFADVALDRQSLGVGVSLLDDGGNGLDGSEVDIGEYDVGSLLGEEKGGL